MTERSSEKSAEPLIYVGAKGHRYVKAKELLRDPNVKRRLERADKLASGLGLKGQPNDDSPDA